MRLCLKIKWGAFIWNWVWSLVLEHSQCTQTLGLPSSTTSMHTKRFAQRDVAIMCFSLLESYFIIWLDHMYLSIYQLTDIWYIYSVWQL